MKRRPIAWKQILIIFGFVILFFLLMDLNNRISELNRLNTQLDRMQAEVGGLIATEVELKEKILYSTSESAVDAFARENGMIQEGEKLIIPIPFGTPLSVESTNPTPTPPIIKNHSIWWALFFGD